MRSSKCPQCGKSYELVDDVLAFVRRHADTVRPADVAAYFGISGTRASIVLTRLSERGLIVRVRHGVYSANPELRRQALVAELERLTPA
jgi:predicted transcriptional regulator of viral defense system